MGKHSKKLSQVVVNCDIIDKNSCVWQSTYMIWDNCYPSYISKFHWSCSYQKHLERQNEMYSHTSFECWSGFFLQILFAKGLHFQALHFLETTFHPLLVENLLWNTHLMYLFLGAAVLFHYRMPWIHHFWWLLLLCHTNVGMYCSIYTASSEMWLFWVVHIPPQSLVRTVFGNILCLKRIVFLFW